MVAAENKIIKWEAITWNYHTVDEVTWWSIFFFFFENHQGRYQSLEPYNKMVMLIQLGCTVKNLPKAFVQRSGSLRFYKTESQF